MRAPARLTREHDVSQFRSGQVTLDEWLQHRALESEGLSARTYVVCADEPPGRVIGYYALSTTMEQRIALPSAKLRRGAPERVPLLLIGRLAVDVDFQGKGLGADLLRDALLRCIAAAEIVGARAIVTQAIDDQAAAFYKRHGFHASPLGERVLLLPLETVRAALAN